MSRLVIALFITAGIGRCRVCDASRRSTPQAAGTPQAVASGDTCAAVEGRLRCRDQERRSTSQDGQGRLLVTNRQREGHLPGRSDGKEKVAKADAEAAYRNTSKVREDARDTKAEATYNVAKEKCDDLAGNAKDVCVKEADAALVKAKADAKVDRVAADAQSGRGGETG